MQKQKTNLESSIKVSQSQDSNTFPLPQIFIKPFVVANTIALIMTPSIDKNTLNQIKNEKIVLEQYDNGRIKHYPYISLQYENGVISNKEVKKNEIPIQISNEISFNMSENENKQIIDELRKENVVLKNKLKNSFPTHIVTYISICGLILGVCITLMILMFGCGVFLIDPFYVFCAVLIALTLLCTAIAATYDWKDFLNEK
ncbi:hypothetical protein ACI3DN_12585 [Sellimonas catena]|uniref:Uncharacterized protein n=1 Tax=Sellimonas catena TaxID=2994035 RepID=A0A9W6FE52_9FIRM|nr:hypothetical protein [Sellimonas catena]GLG06369.1 hypothetical protein Selli1_35430 [Sellimonas catena]